jgi:hypothetical protein
MPGPERRPVTGWDERLIAATGWIGEHPTDWRDVAHLLVYPVAAGIEEEMLATARLLDLRSATTSELTRVPETVAYLTVRDGWVILMAPGGAALERLVTDEWTVDAARRGYVVVTVGLDPYSGQADELDGYLSRGERLHMGLLSVRT